MRVGIISDMHGNIYALEAVLAELNRLGVDRIVCNGDVAFGLVTPAATVDRVRELDIPCVRGNTDDFPGQPERFAGHAELGPAVDWFRRDLGDERSQWLVNLPLRRTDLDGALLQFHGAPDNNEDSVLHVSLRPMVERSLDEQAAVLSDYATPVVTFGHTHTPSEHRVGSKLLVNPGSVSYQLTTRDPRARFALLEGEGDRWTARLHAVEYDWERAARTAESLGLPNSAAVAYQLRHGHPKG